MVSENVYEASFTMDVKFGSSTRAPSHGTTDQELIFFVLLFAE